MMWNEQTQQEARRMVEALTEKQWKTVSEYVVLLAKPLTEEEKAKHREEQEKRVKAMAERRADFELKKFQFGVMRNSLEEGFSVPERYEWSIPDVREAFDMVFHPLAGHEEVYDLANYMFNLGFKRGVACQQSRMDKRFNEAVKKACHPSQIKALHQARGDM